MNRNVKCVLIGFFVLMFVGCACADALPFSGEVVQLTSTQTEDIVWDENNFGGFCYNLSDDDCIGTETLTIATNTLTGQDIDRIIDVGNLTYTTSPIWREYELHKNLGLTVESDHPEGDSGYWIEFWMGERYVAINGNVSKLAKPLVEFNDTDAKTLATGEEWDLGGGFALTAKQIDLDGDKVWISLCKDGMEINSSVIGTGSSDLQKRVYTYTEDVAGEDDVPIFSCYVSEVFRGTDSNIMRVKYVFLIDNEVLQISTGENYGNMAVVAACSSNITLKNNNNIYLNLNTTAPIMGNLSFKTAYNTSSIEFYPHLIRDELPVLSGGGGFASVGCADHSWNLSENYTIGWNQVDLEGDKAWIVLCREGVVVDEQILTEEWSAPVDSDCRYSYVMNVTEIINATLKMVFRGCDLNMIELGEVYQRSEVDGSILINNESRLLPAATEPCGTSWNLSDGYMLTVPNVSLDGDEVRLQLSKDGAVVKEKILNEDYANRFTYTSESGVGGVNCVVDRIFRGCEANAVKLVNVSQYSDADGTALIVDESHLFKSGDPEGTIRELSDGGVLMVKDIDLNGDKTWLELSKDSTVLKEAVRESDDMFEYENGLESVSCVVEAVFRGSDANIVKLKNVTQYSGTGVCLIDNESMTYPVGVNDRPMIGLWELEGGYSLSARDIDLNGDKVWLLLLKDGAVMEDAIIDSRKCDADQWFEYYNATGALVFSTYVDAVFRGTDSNFVSLESTIQYSEIDGTVFEWDKKKLSIGIADYPADAAIALRIAVGSLPFDDAADVNGDGNVTSLDALMILQAAAD